MEMLKNAEMEFFHFVFFFLKVIVVLVMHQRFRQRLQFAGDIFIFMSK